MKSNITILCVTSLFICVLVSTSQLMPARASEIAPTPTWAPRALMPTARGQAAVIAGDDGLIYVMGGYNGTDVLSTMEAYNPSTNKWATKAPMLNATRGAAVAKGLNGIIYVISGWNVSSTYTNTVQAFNTTSNTWTLKRSIPTSVWMASAATGDDGKIYVIGGEEPGGVESAKVQVYDPSTDSWTNGTDMPTARSKLGVVKGSDGLIYALGGWNGSRATSVVEAYNLYMDTWTPRVSMPIEKLEFGVTLGPDNKIYVVGGGTDPSDNTGPFYNTVEAYDPRTDSWTFETLMPTVRKELGATVDNNGKIYVIGGANGNYLRNNEELTVVFPDPVYQLIEDRFFKDGLSLSINDIKYFIYYLVEKYDYELNPKINNLTQGLDNVTQKIDSLPNEIDSLNQRIDAMANQLFYANVAIAILAAAIVAAVAISIITRRKTSFTPG